MNRPPPRKVLVFPGGTEVGLEIFRSLRYCKEVELFAAANGSKQHAPFVFSRYRELPNVSEAACLPALQALIAEWAIDCIFPANPIVIDFLDRQRDTLACPVVQPAREVLAVSRSKTATWRMLRGTLPVAEILAGPLREDDFPVFVKPDAMYGAQGARMVADAAVLAAAPPGPNDIVCEYLPGPEYTVDCFSDRHGRLLFAGARSRERIRMGTSMHSEAAGADLAALFADYAQAIQRLLPLRGAWFFQAKADAQGKFKVLEVEARVAGTMAYHRVRGVNFALLAVLDLFGHDVTVRPVHDDVAIDRALLNRYRHRIAFATVYVDLDDTLLVKGRLNLQLVRFLYQCVNEGKRIVLLSKSLAADPAAVLRRWRIAELFDAVCWLNEASSKADCITDAAAIFIDDSFSQRMEVAQKTGIPTFDPSMVEMLLDDRGF